MDFQTLYDTHFDRVKRTAKAFLHNEEDALDAVQDTFLKAYESLDSYDESASSISTWLVMICKSICQDKLRKRKRENKVFVNLEENDNIRKDETSSPDLLMEAEEDEVALRLEFEKLPDKVKTAFTLRHYDGLSYKAIAEEMNVSINTVKTWIRRGRNTLLQKISPN